MAASRSDGQPEINQYAPAEMTNREGDPALAQAGRGQAADNRTDRQRHQNRARTSARAAVTAVIRLARKQRLGHEHHVDEGDHRRAGHEAGGQVTKVPLCTPRRSISRVRANDSQSRKSRKNTPPAPVVIAPHGGSTDFSGSGL